MVMKEELVHDWLRHPATLLVSITLAASACTAGGGLEDCSPEAYDLTIAAGGGSLPGRLELVCRDGAPWGRLHVLFSGAVTHDRSTGDTLVFVAGGGMTELKLVPEDSTATGAITLANGQIYRFTATRDLAGPPPSILDHAVLEPWRPDLVSSDSGESYPIRGPDGSLYFTRHGYDLRQQTILRLGAYASETTPVLTPPAGATDRGPFPTPHGALLFSSTRDPADPMRAGSTYRIWRFDPEDNGLPRPVPWPLGDAPSNPQQPVVADGWLYFVDDRPGGLGDRDVYRAPWNGGRPGPVEHLPSPVSSPGDDASVAVSADGRMMVVASTAGPDGQGGDDLYLLRRTDEGWSDRVNLGLPVNTFANEYGAWLDPLGLLWFTSDRFGAADVFRVRLEDLTDVAIDGPD